MPVTMSVCTAGKFWVKTGGILLYIENFYEKFNEVRRSFSIALEGGIYD